MKQKILIIGHIWPEPQTTAAGTRILQLIDVLQENQYEIYFVSAGLKSEKSFPLAQLNIETYEIKINDDGFDELVQEINPTIVIFDRFLTEEQFGWRIAEKCPKAIRILDTEDLHFLRKARQEAFKKGCNMDAGLLLNDITKREIASILRCDISLIISNFELKLLEKHFKIDPTILVYIPFMVPRMEASILNQFPIFKSRKHFISIGNFKHEPNVQAVFNLKKSIWPLIRKKLPKVELHIYGAYVPNKIKLLHNVKEGFIIKGWAEDKGSVIQGAKVLLAPLEFGAGLKGKLIDSMIFGTPNCTSQIGAEGMHANLDWNGFISNNDQDFADKSIELYTNEAFWLASQQNGIQIINQCFSKEKYSKLMMQTIDMIQSNLENHRLQNIMGAILQHHSFQSTKYLSKWIEEKNSKR